MTLPSTLDRACREGCLLLVWCPSPFPLEEREVANRAVVLARWLEQPAGTSTVPLPDLPPLPILSLDPSDRVERSFGQAGRPLQIVRSRRDVPARERHTLLKLAGDLTGRYGVILSQAEILRLRSDVDKRYLLDEAARAAGDGAVLLVGCEPAGEDFRAWWSVLGPLFRRAACFALGDPAANWPPGITCLETSVEDLAAALRACLVSHEVETSVSADLAWDTAMLRRLLTEALGDEELDRLCYDHFRSVYEEFSGGMGKGQKVHRLLEYCDRQGQLDRLADQVRRRNPARYSQFVSGMRQPSSTPGSAPLSKGDGDTSAPQVLGAGKRWAVLVGVNEYDDAANYGNLTVCVKDVAATREQLVAGGFEEGRVRLLTDGSGELPTKANILAALKAVADATEPDDLLLFYYSGHGDEAGGESYLLARDGRRLVLSDTAVPLARVKAIIEAAPARAKVVLLDACHSGANIGSKGAKPMSEAFIRRVFEEAEGLAILASCKQGQVSYEWRTEERSVFTHYLLEALRGEADRDGKGLVTVQDASRHVVDGVKLWASQRNLSQTPTLQYTVAGDIILARYKETSAENQA